MEFVVLATELMELRSSQPRMLFERKLSRLTKGEMCVLKYLRNHGNCAHPKNLSDEMLVSTARVAVILKHMERDGLILRIPDGLDNRKTIVQLSGKGTALLEQYQQEILRYITRIMEKLGKQDAEEYIRIQKRLVGILAELSSEVG